MVLGQKSAKKLTAPAELQSGQPKSDRLLVPATARAHRIGAAARATVPAGS